MVGLDSSPDMLRQARKRLPDGSFLEADLAAWSPPARTDLLFANAVFQWVPDHPGVLQRLLAALPAGGVLAVQMPDNTQEPALALMSEVATSGPWADELALAAAARDDLPPPAAYYDLLRPLCTRLDIWHTAYNHVLAGPEAIVEWFRGSGAAALSLPARREHAPGFHRRLYRAYHAGLSRALRRPGAVAVPATVHRRGAVSGPASVLTLEVVICPA